MSSSSKPVGKGGFLNVPSPTGSRSGARGGTAYSRFIPREELGDFANWRPGSLGEAGAVDPGPHPAGQHAAAGTGAADPAPSTPAEPTVDEWRASIAAARQAGYQDGYRDGTAALESFKQSFAAQATAQIGALLQAFDEQLTAQDEHIARALARTAVQLARQVLRHELSTQPALVARVAGDAVNAVMLSARHITVKVHPLDLALVAEGAEEALNARGARLLADAKVQRGGVMVESEVGAIDARIGTRWAQAAAALGGDVGWDTDAMDAAFAAEAAGIDAHTALAATANATATPEIVP